MEKLTRVHIMIKKLCAQLHNEISNKKNIIIFVPL